MMEAAFQDLLPFADKLASYGTLLLALVALFSLRETRRQGKRTDAALKAAEEQVALAREHNRLSVRPVVVAETILTDNGGHLGVRNIGNGPALVDAVEVRGPSDNGDWLPFDRNRAADLKELIKAGVNPHVRVDTHALRAWSPMGVSTGATPTLLLSAKLPTSAEGLAMEPKQRREHEQNLRGVLAHIRFRVAFRSLYDERDQIVVSMKPEESG